MLSRSVMSNSLRHGGLWPTRLLCPWGFSRQQYQSGLPCPLPCQRRRSSALQAYSSPSELPGNTGVGSLSLLQGIFPIRELKRDLLHCRWILYQLSYEGSPNVTEGCVINSVSYCSSQLMLSIVPGQCGAGIATPF